MRRGDHLQQRATKSLQSLAPKYFLAGRDARLTHTEGCSAGTACFPCVMGLAHPHTSSKSKTRL